MTAILRWIRGLFAKNTSGPRIIPRQDHNISRKNISAAALKVLYRLHDNGYQAYLVGGCVRDLLLGKSPKDYDVVTDAKPEQVRRLFRNCRLIGRRFRLAHVVFRDEIIEVATFRANHEGQSQHIASLSDEGRILRDNVFGTIEDDAWRRDFTVNALYYSIDGFSIVDYTGGMRDIRAQRLNMIGDVDKRFIEDPVRILRALRFKAKLGLSLSPAIKKGIAEHRQKIFEVPSARLFEEVVKLFHSGESVTCYNLMQEFGLFRLLFTQTSISISRDNQARDFIQLVLKKTDERVQSDLSVNPAFLFAAFLWYPLQGSINNLITSSKMRYNQALAVTQGKVLSKQVQQFAIPKRLQLMMVDIWRNQSRLERRHPRRIEQLLTEKSFRASYDFLLLRAEVDSTLTHLADWWTKFIDADEKERKDMLNQVHRKRRRPNKKPA